MNQVSVFDVADADNHFSGYTRRLWESGVWSSHGERMRDLARRVMDPGRPEAEPPPIGPEWTPERRRLLVALTWSNPTAAPTYPLTPTADLDRVHSQERALWPRTYEELWADVRNNLKWITIRASQSGYRGDICRDVGRLGLVKDERGRPPAKFVVTQLTADAPYRTWHEGYLMTWWDVVDVAEALALEFTAADDAPTGMLRLDLEALSRNLLRARLIEDLKEDVPRTLEKKLDELKDTLHGPQQLHRLVTADGVVTPPAAETKYRRLFDFLDSQRGDPNTGEVYLDREKLEELVHVDQSAPRRVRGAKGSPGLPKQAVTKVRWWRGPWDGDRRGDELMNMGDAQREVFLGELRERLDGQSQTRAWLATGFRAVPRMRSAELQSVDFVPFRCRRNWWPWRDHLRKGRYTAYIHNMA